MNSIDADDHAGPRSGGVSGARRSIAEQDARELGGPSSVLSRQRRDHIQLDQLLSRLAQVPPGEEDRVLLRIWRLVFPHAFAEESVLWPLLRRVSPDGQDLTLRVEREHQEINELVTRLETLESGSGERRRVLDRVVALLRQDVRDEEDELLPRLQMSLTPAQLRRAGAAWEAVRRIAPTRAHPVVARRPPGNVLAASPLSLLDRCRDRIDARLHRHEGGAAPKLRALSSALRRASHAVEGLPGMRAGEDPATRRGGASRLRWGAAAVVTVFAGWVIVGAVRRRRDKLAADGILAAPRAV